MELQKLQGAPNNIKNFCEIFRTNTITNLLQKFLQVYILTILIISIQLEITPEKTMKLCEQDILTCRS